MLQLIKRIPESNQSILLVLWSLQDMNYSKDMTNKSSKKQLPNLTSMFLRDIE